MENSVKFRWYKTTVSKKDWNSNYSLTPTFHTFLGSNKDEVFMGFLSVSHPPGCLEITNPEELDMIKTNLKNSNTYPRPD